MAKKKTRLKKKRAGLGLQIRTFKGSDGETYLVFRGPSGSFHVFVETEAKQAARECGVTEEGNTQSMWQTLWDRQS